MIPVCVSAIEEAKEVVSMGNRLAMRCRRTVPPVATICDFVGGVLLPGTTKLMGIRNFRHSLGFQ